MGLAKGFPKLNSDNDHNSLNRVSSIDRSRTVDRLEHNNCIITAVLAHRIGWCTVTSFVPSGKVPST